MEKLTGERVNWLELLYGPGDPDVPKSGGYSRQIFRNKVPVGTMIVTSTAEDVDSGDAKQLWNETKPDR